MKNVKHKNSSRRKKEKIGKKKEVNSLDIDNYPYLDSYGNYYDEQGGKDAD